MQVIVPRSSPKPARSRWRGGLRWLGRGVAILLGLVIVLLAVVLVAIHTAWGREQLRARAELIAQDFFVGKVRLGNVEGSIFTRLVVRDISIDDAHGEQAVAIAEASFDIASSGLLTGDVLISELIIRGAKVTARQRADGINLAGLLRPQDEPSAWDVRLDKISIDDSRAEFHGQGADEVMHLDDLAGTANASVKANGPIQARLHVAASWRERAVPLQISGDVRVVDEIVSMTELTASVDQIVVTATDVHMNVNAPRISGQVSMVAPASSVLRVVPTLVLPGDVRLQLELKPGEHIIAAIKASVGSESMSGEATIDPDAMRLRGEFRTTDLNAQALLQSTPPTAITATMKVDLGLDDALEGARAIVGNVKIDGTGRYGEGYVNEASLDLDVEIANGSADVVLAASAPGDTKARFEGVIDFDDAKVLRLTKGRLVASTAQIDRAYGGLPQVRGALSADLALAGTLAPGMPSLSVAGQLRGARLRYATTAVANASVAIEASGLPAAPKGDARLVATGVSIGSDVIGVFSLKANATTDGRIAVTARSGGSSERWNLDLDATVDVNPAKVEVRIGPHDLRLRGVRWQGQGGQITVLPKAQHVLVTNFRTGIAEGTVLANANYHYGGRRQGTVAGDVNIKGVDLAQIDQMLGLGGRLTGLANLNGELRQVPGGMSGSVTGTIDELRVTADAPPVKIELEAAISPRKIRIEGSLRGDELGRVAMMMDVRAPARVTDVEAWRRIEGRDLTGGTFTIEALDLAVLATMLGLEVDPTPLPTTQPGGRIDGSLTLSPLGSSGTLRAHNVTGHALLPGPLDVEATLTSSMGPNARPVLAIDAKAHVATVGTGRIEASVELPARPLDLDAWLALDGSALRGATLSANGIVLDAALARRLGMRNPWAGKMNVAIELAPALAGATAKLELVGLHGGPLLTPVSATLVATFDKRVGLTAQLTSALQGGQPLLSAKAEMKLPASLIANWRAITPDMIMKSPLSGTAEMIAVPAGALAKAFGRPGRLGGTVSFAATLGGTAKRPIADATLTLKDIGNRRRGIAELIATLHYGDGATTLDVVSSQDHGGTLKLAAQAPQDDWEAASVQVVAADFDLEPLTRLGPSSMIGISGRLDADVQVAGLDRRTTAMAGSLRLREGELSIHALIGTLRDANVLLTAKDGQVVFEAEGRIGSGRVTLKGKGAFEGILPNTAQADLKVVNVQIVNEIQPILSGKVRLEVKRDGALWRATTTVTDAKVVVPERTGQELHPIGVPADVVFIENGRPAPAATAPSPGFAAIIGERPLRPYLIAKVVLKAVRVQTEEYRGEVGGTLTTEVGDEAIWIHGAVESNQSDVTLFDRRYRTVRAAVRFDGSLDPILDIELVHEFPDLALHMMVTGRLSKPTLRLRSDPSTYSEGQLFGILLGGRPGADPGRGLRDAATALTSSFLSQKVTGYLDPYLPIDIDVLTYEAATGDSTAAVTIGKWITSRLFVAYRQRVESRVDENGGEAQLEYWLGRRLMLDGVVGDSGVHGVDLLWTKRW
ncbi:MAG: translocation/assembly module TamB domain-containing protein [Myxococcales bacterium]|nr:translocation/assembly module TamB domain-containing protein [Myxococcales bacterium]